MARQQSKLEVVDIPKVLVTGASGFIASRVIFDLLLARTADNRAAYRVRGTVRGPEQSPQYDELRQLAQRATGSSNARFELVRLDLLQDTGWDR